jgi:hypothetical protein
MERILGLKPMSQFDAAARGSVQDPDVIPFFGRVGLDVASRLARALRRRGQRERPACYEVDCAAVTGFSEPALVALGLLGEELRDRGSALVLANGPWRRPEPWTWPATSAIRPAPGPQPDPFCPTHPLPR